MSHRRAGLCLMLSLAAGGALANTADLVYTTLQQPCRIIDTRAAGAGGPLTAARNFVVSKGAFFENQGGTPGGCGIGTFTSAKAVMINFVAVSPTAAGNLRGSAWPHPVSAGGSIINYQTLSPALNVANGVVFPICDSNTTPNCPDGFDINSFDMTIEPNGGNVHLVADVLGFFSPLLASPTITTDPPDSQRHLPYTTFQQPCRIIDTRAAGAGGALTHGNTRYFRVAGNSGFEFQGGNGAGCNVPSGATVAVINFVAVNPQGAGNLKGAAYPRAIPATGSIINYQRTSPVLNIANGLLFPICDPTQTFCTADISLQANGADVDLVADVLGFFFEYPTDAIVPLTQRDLTYTTFEKPCRIIDTRSSSRLSPSLPRNFKIAGTEGFPAQGGTVGGCNVPSGATSAMINFIAVGALGAGNLRGSAFPRTIPAVGSILNYQLLNPPLNLANGLFFPICDPEEDACTSDITLQANGAGVHVVADVIGYARRYLPEPDPMAIYVSVNDPESANDAECGLRPDGRQTGDHPCSTIAYGLSRAVIAGRTKVFVAEGRYTEVVDLRAGISIYGGFEDSTWVRDPALYSSLVTGGPLALTGVSIANITIDGMDLQPIGGGTNGNSSFGIKISNGIQIHITNNRITAGPGGSGNAGTNGTVGSNGGDGSQGNPGCEDSGFGCSSCSQPSGGYPGGGSSGHDGGTGGRPGHGTSGGFSGGIASSGTAGGAGANCGGSRLCDGSRGSDGNAGTVGSSGSGGASLGLFTESGYFGVAGGIGGGGGPGHGGGGGGGGGGGDDSCDSYGSSGGGGGGGGEGGFGAGGGTGAGGSFGVYFGNVTGSVVGNTITTIGGPGGAGGVGGLGGSGGANGPGGPYGGESEQDDGGDGARGGNGGNGGRGGHGGGGGGGPSMGVVLINSQDVTVSGNSFAIGAGGPGGTTQPGGNPGATGATATTYATTAPNIEAPTETLPQL